MNEMTPTRLASDPTAPNPLSDSTAANRIDGFFRLTERGTIQRR